MIMQGRQESTAIPWLPISSVCCEPLFRPNTLCLVKCDVTARGIRDSGKQIIKKNTFILAEIKSG